MIPVGITDTTNMVSALKANAQRLGLTWTIRFGSVTSVGNNVTYVRLDDAGTGTIPLPAVPLGAQPATGCRVSCLLTSPTDIFIVAATPSPGTPVLRLRRDANQSIANGGTGDFILWDTIDLDLFGTFVLGSASWTPTLAGWYWANGRSVWTANPTDRRGYLINKNGTTGSTGTVGGASVQAATTGSTQCGGGGLVYLDGVADFIGARAIQNSGGALTISNTDGGSVLEAVYLGSPLTT